MRLIYILLTLLFSGFSVYTQNSEPQINWAQLGLDGKRTGLTTKDKDGNLYVMHIVTHNTSLTLNGTTVSGGSNGVVAIIKYDENKNPVWIKGVPFVFDAMANISPHKFLFHNNSLYLFVSYRQNNISMDGIDFPPFESYSTAGDLVLIKVNASTRNTEWIKFIARPECAGNIPPDNHEIYIDKNDKVHAIGTFNNIMRFDNGLIIGDSTNPTGLNAFHIIYDTLGNFESADTLGVYGTYGSKNYNFFSIDKENNIYRYIKQTKDFIKYDQNRNVLFSKQFQTNGDFKITGMKVDPWGNAFLSGWFTSTNIEFDNNTVSKSGGVTDALLIKLNNTNGNIEWIRTLDDPQCDSFEYIDMDKIGNIYLIGLTEGSCLGSNYFSLSKIDSSGNIMYNKLIKGFNSSLPNQSDIETIRADNQMISLKGGNIFITGEVVYNGVTKGYMMELGTCNTPPPTVTLDYSDICEGETAALSVDSLSGYKYLWSNGDTTATTQITESGRYSVVAIEDEECYSESKDFYINVHPLPDTSVTVSNNVLTAVESTENTTYQWIDCQNNNTPISGATEQTFEPAENGEYAVIVTSENGCSETSSCHVINTLSVKNNPMLDKQITLYPNPTSDKINVQTDLDIAEVYLLDLQGKQLQTSNLKEVDLSKLSSGIYLVKVKLKNNEIWTNKVIKN